MSIETPGFLLRLVDEHRVFQDGFGRLYRRAKDCADPAARNEILIALLNFSRVFFEEFHHLKEETLLFPVLAADPRIHAGGPECVLHFDQQMRSPPLEIARRACSAVGVAPREPPWPPELQRLREKGSPLVIPLEDHEAGRILLRAIDSCLLEEKGGAGEKVLRLFETYQDLQERHIRKENGCLFCIARTLVDHACWRDLETREPQWTVAGLHPLAAALIPS